MENLLEINNISKIFKIRNGFSSNILEAVANVNIKIKSNEPQIFAIAGESGSGKSTLAFETIYAEGQRKYVESLSAYARQFLQMMDKPDLDRIDGLSPAIAIDQKTVSKNPRSTVGTVTEIYDYLRLLYARIGVPYSPTTGKPITKQTSSEIIKKVKSVAELKNAKSVLITFDPHPRHVLESGTKLPLLMHIEKK